MKQIPKNITIGAMWDSGIWYWRLWLVAPFGIVFLLLGSLFISALTGQGLWFLLGYPFAIALMVLFRVWDKKLSL